MAVDMFIEIPGIVGEFAGAKSGGLIQIEDFSFGATAHHSGGQRSGRTSYSDVTIFKFVDKSSPILLSYLATNRTLKIVKITARKVGTGQKPFYELELKDAFIASFTSAGCGADKKIGAGFSDMQKELMIQENISLNFSSMKVTYYEQDSDGGMGGPISVELQPRGGN